MRLCSSIPLDGYFLSTFFHKLFFLTSFLKVQEIEELLEKESSDVDHEEMYDLLQRSVIEYEINDPRIFQVRSPGYKT